MEITLSSESVIGESVIEDSDSESEIRRPPDIVGNPQSFSEEAPVAGEVYTEV